VTVVHIPGKKSRHIMLYALSTCGWCRKTKQLLDDLGVEYNYEYVDKLQGEEREEAMRKIKAWNPSCSFPTVVLDNEECIVGYREDELRGALER
jgi:glutaredoxin-like protein NrdH